MSKPTLREERRKRHKAFVLRRYEDARGGERPDRRLTEPHYTLAEAREIIAGELRRHPDAPWYPEWNRAADMVENPLR